MMSTLHDLTDGYLDTLASGQVVKIRIASANKTFHIDKALICEYSAFFRGIIDLNFDGTEPIDLDDVSIEVMTSVVTWLYGLDLWYKFKHENTYASFTDFPHLVDIYIFADKYDMIRLRNQCVDEFMHIMCGKEELKSHTIKIWEAFGKLFRCVPVTSKWRQMVLSWLCCNISIEAGWVGRKTIDYIVASLPPRELSEVMWTWYNDWSDSCAQWRQPTEYWREHEGDHPQALLPVQEQGSETGVVATHDAEA